MCMRNDNSGGGEGRQRRGEDRISLHSNLLDRQQGRVGNLSENLKFTHTHMQTPPPPL